jgi:hypothetical protein
MLPKKSLLLWLAPLLVSPYLWSQDGSGVAVKKLLQPSREDLKPWILEYKARVARAFQYQFGLTEQPGTATIQSGNTVKFVPNPEHYLIKHSLTFQFSELFLSSSDFGSALKNYYDYSPSVDGKSLSVSKLCRNQMQSALDCLASSGAWWQRALSGVKATFSLSERTRVASGIIVPEGPFPSDYDKAGEIDFDPSQLFILGSNWKAAATSLKDVNLTPSKGTEFAECSAPQKSETSLNSGNTKKAFAACVTRYGGSKRGGIGFLAAAVPTFKFIRQTQFDFLKSGGILIPAPFPETALNSYTFAWDLRRLIAPTKERVVVADAVKANTPTETGTALCVTISNGLMSYMPISDSFPEKSCEPFANAMSDGHYFFACVEKSGETLKGTESARIPSGTSCKWKTNKTQPSPIPR